MSPSPLHWLGRLRRLRRRWWRGAAPVDFVYSESYPVNLAAVDALRGERILNALDDAGLLSRRRAHRAPLATFRDLRRVHTDEYLESLDRAGALLAITGYTLPEEAEDRILKAQRAMVGGTIAAARLARASRGIAVNLGGGLHHAFADRGERFCVYNDVAVAVAGLRKEGFTGRVLVVDLDLHDGDGTRALFAKDATVHTFSIHNQTARDAEPAVEATVLELPEGTGDEAFLAVLREHLPAVFSAFVPALVFYVAGCDGAADDGLGNWQLSARGLLERDLFVVREVEKLPGLPLVVVLGGGYGAGAWRYTARFLGTLLSGGKEFVPPATEDTTLLHYRRIARALLPYELTGERGGRDDRDDPEGDGDDWLTEEDLRGLLGAAPPSRRLLGYYSPAGLELALERAGLFERLRVLGFSPRLELDLDNPAGETVRLFGSPRRNELLIEIRMRIDRATVPGLSLLRVEWLLLQNPRLSFGLKRPRLPGQNRPGLGMLQDAIALLVLACDRLRLDGLVFVPSHYHTAAQGRVLRFLDPAREGRFRALRRALKGVSLTEATQAVDALRVVDEDGRPVAWEPAPMILPLSEKLVARVEGEEYEGRVAAEEGRSRYRLVR